jgi:hypothetical protein
MDRRAFSLGHFIPKGSDCFGDHLQETRITDNPFASMAPCDSVPVFAGQVSPFRLPELWARACPVMVSRKTEKEFREEE